MKRSADLIKQSSIIFVAIAVFNILSLLYQLYMVRSLSPINYGILNSLFSVFMILSVPSGALQTVITKFVSTFYAIRNYEGINLLLRSFVTKTSAFGLVVLLVLVFGSKGIASFLKIDSPLLIVILGAITFFAILLPLTQGGLQGLQRFGYLGVTIIANGSLKLILGIIFVSIGLEVMGAMSALVISTLATLLLSFVMLAFVLPKPLDSIPKSSQMPLVSPDPEVNFSEIYGYFYATVIVFLCFIMLTNIDVVLVKHFFKPLEAGYYSIAQMAGKIILSLPIAITMVMFPKASELHAKAKTTFHLLLKSLLYVGILCGAAALICIFFPGLIIVLLSSEEHLQCIPLVRIFSVTMVFFALTYVLLFYHLSIHSLGFIYSLVLFTVLQILMIILFHQSLSQILYIMCGNAVLLFLINLYIAFKGKQLHVTSGIDSNS